MFKEKRMDIEKEIMLDIKAGKGLIDGILRSKIIKEDIYKLDLINVKTSLDQCKDVILIQQETIESLKCCGNCGIGKITTNDELDCKHWHECKGNAFDKNKDSKTLYWKPIK